LLCTLQAQCSQRSPAPPKRLHYLPPPPIIALAASFPVLSGQARHTDARCHAPSATAPLKRRRSVTRPHIIILPSTQLPSPSPATDYPSSQLEGLLCSESTSHLRDTRYLDRRQNGFFNQAQARAAQDPDDFDLPLGAVSSLWQITSARLCRLHHQAGGLHQDANHPSDSVYGLPENGESCHRRQQVVWENHAYLCSLNRLQRTQRLLMQLRES
jgi:hypothetical protein